MAGARVQVGDERHAQPVEPRRPARQRERHLGAGQAARLLPRGPVRQARRLAARPEQRARRRAVRGRERALRRPGIYFSSEPGDVSMSPPMSSKPPPVVPPPNPEPISSSSAVSNPGPNAAEALAVVQPQLGGELVALEQGDVVDAAGERLGRLDLDRAVALEPGRGRDQLADDHVLLQAREAVDLALERRVGQHLRGLLEGGRREERVGRQRGLGDAEDDLLERRRSRRRPPRSRRSRAAARDGRRTGPAGSVVSPFWSIRTFLSIWRTITSMCLSLMSTPWDL